MRHFRPEDLFSLRFASDAAIAPGGDEFAYALRRPGQESALWRGFEGRDASGPLTRGPRDVRPSYAPDGSQIAFLRGAGEAAQIFLLDRRGGEAMPFTRLRHGVRDFAWSPDGRAIAVIAPSGPEGPLPLRDEESARPAPKDAYGALLLLQTDGTWRQLSQDGVDCSHPVFSPSGREIAVLARTQRDSVPCLGLAATDGGALRCLVGAEYGPGPAAFSPDGSRLALLASPRRGAAEALCTLAREGGEPVPYAPALPAGLSFADDLAPVYAPDGRSIFALLTEGGIRRLMEVRPHGDLRPRTPPGLEVRSFALDETGGRIALIAADVSGPARFELRDAAGRLLLRSRHEHPALAAVARIAPQALQLPQGRHGTLYLPASGDPRATVLIASSATHLFSSEAQALAAQGLAAIVAPPGLLRAARDAAAALSPAVGQGPIGIAAEGELAGPDLALLDAARAAVLTNPSAPPPHAARQAPRSVLRDGPHILRITAGDGGAEVGATDGETLHRFPAQRGPAAGWTAAAQAERLALEVGWLLRYLAE